MNDSVFFATFDPLFVNAPDACNFCLTQPPAFSYEYCIDREGGGKRHYIKGYCCMACAGGLLKKLENQEALEWAQEEQELDAEHLDVSDLQKRRLATLGSSRS